MVVVYTQQASEGSMESQLSSGLVIGHAYSVTDVRYVSCQFSSRSLHSHRLSGTVVGHALAAELDLLVRQLPFDVCRLRWILQPCLVTYHW